MQRNYSETETGEGKSRRCGVGRVGKEYFQPLCSRKNGDGGLKSGYCLAQVLSRDLCFHIHHNCSVLCERWSAGDKRMSSIDFCLETQQASEMTAFLYFAFIESD